MIEFDYNLIMKMFNEGKMLKEICEYYGCNRNKLYRYIKSVNPNANFRNNVNSRSNQSNLMSGGMNPTKGRKRTKNEMNGISKANREKAYKNWNKIFANGITYEEYAKICRYIVPREMQTKNKWKELEIDHVFSIKDCWINKIHPRYVSHTSNLRIISSSENKAKGDKSLVSLDGFLSMVGVQRLSKAQFNWKRVE